MRAVDSRNVHAGSEHLGHKKVVSARFGRQGDHDADITVGGVITEYGLLVQSGHGASEFECLRLGLKIVIRARCELLQRRLDRTN